MSSVLAAWSSCAATACSSWIRINSSFLLYFLAQLSCHLVDWLAVIGVAGWMFLLFLAYCECCELWSVCCRMAVSVVWDIVAWGSLLQRDMYWTAGYTIWLIFPILWFSIELCGCESLELKLVQSCRAAQAGFSSPVAWFWRLMFISVFHLFWMLLWSYLDQTGYGTILIAPGLITHLFLVQFKLWAATRLTFNVNL